MNTTNSAVPQTVAVATVKLRTISGAHKGPGCHRVLSFVRGRSSPGDCSIRLSVGSPASYLTSVTNGGRFVTLPVERQADAEQAEMFHTLLAERRAELCDRLDQQAVKLARHEQGRDSAGIRRKRLRIKEIGAEIRDIDRMMQGLRVQLVGVEHKRCPV
jgi:hypothetical protein